MSIFGEDEARVDETVDDDCEYFDPWSEISALRAEYSANGDHITKERADWEMEQAKRVVWAKRTATIIYNVSAETLKCNHSILWYPDDGSTIICLARSFYNDEVQCHFKDKLLSRWVRGIYLLSKKQFLTNSWFDDHNCQDAIPNESTAQERSRIIQISAFRALKKSGIIASDAKHILNAEMGSDGLDT